MFCCPSGFFAVETGLLSKYKFVYEQSLQKIEKEYQTQIKPAKDAYYKNLIIILNKAKEKADLKAIVAIKEEEERFLNEKTVPAKSPARLNLFIGKAQAVYNKSISVKKKNKDREVIKLLSL